MGLNWFDFLIISIIVFSSLPCFFKGFLNSFLSFFQLVLAYLISLRFFQDFSSYLDKYMETSLVSYFVSFISIFILSIIVLSVVKNILISIFGRNSCGWVDKIFGLGFGLLKAMFIVSITFITINSLLLLLHNRGLKFNDDWLVKSYTYKGVKIVSVSLDAILEGHIESYITSSLKGVIEDMDIDFLKGKSENIVNNTDNLYTNENMSDVVVDEEVVLIIKRMVSVLPDDKIVHAYEIYKKAKEKSTTNKEKILIYKEILNIYNDSFVTNNTNIDNLLPLESLEKVRIILEKAGK